MWFTPAQCAYGVADCPYRGRLTLQPSSTEEQPRHQSSSSSSRPTKAKTIAQYLGDGYEVQSLRRSHPRPHRAEEPARRSSRRARSASSPSTSRTASSRTTSSPTQKKKTVADLKRALKDADELYLATDEDREGEAIAWHLLEVLKPKVPVKRMVFHEITKDAIEHAQDNTREHRHRARRRAGDPPHPRPPLRLRGLARCSGARSAPASPPAACSPPPPASSSTASASASPSSPRPTGTSPPQLRPRASDADGFECPARPRSTASASPPAATSTTRARSSRGVARSTRRPPTALADALRDAGVPIAVSSRRVQALHAPARRARSPPRPCSRRRRRKLRFSARQTMSVAQSLYENGYITYMRTDSPSLSQQAIDAARSQAASPLRRRDRAREAAPLHRQEQERAGGARGDPPVRRARSAPRASWRRRCAATTSSSTTCIWKRTVASQMADAKGSTASVTIAATAATGTDAVAEFTASGTVITFRGFLHAYEEGHDEERNEPARAGRGEAAAARPRASRSPSSSVEAKGHETTPAAALHRGEPRQDARGARHRPPLHLRVDHLDDHRPRLRHPARPGARAELDRVLRRAPARGVLRRPRRVRLHRRDGGRPRPHRRRRGRPRRLAERLLLRQRRAPRPAQRHRQPRRDRRPRDQLDPHRRRHHPAHRQVRPVPRGPDEERPRPPRRVNMPAGARARRADRREGARAHRRARVRPTASSASNPENGKEIVAKDGRFGPYVTELEPEEPRGRRARGRADPKTGELKPKKPAKKAAAVKPRTASLFKIDGPRDRSTSTPRCACSTCRAWSGVDPESGDEITAQNGRYGPYLKKGTDTRSLASEDLIFEIDLPGALELFAQPKYGARAASSALKEFEADPESGKPIKIKDGRFGAVRHRRRDERDDPARRDGRGDRLRARRAAARRQARQGTGEAEGEGRRPKAAGTRSAAAKKSDARPSEPRRGLFITLEGGDGVGQVDPGRSCSSSLAASEQGRTVLRTREPGGTDLGAEMREIVLHRRGDIAPRAEALLYAADRAHHIATQGAPGARARRDRACRTATSTPRSPTRAPGGCSTPARSATSRSGRPRGCCPTSRSCSTSTSEPAGRDSTASRTPYDRLEAEESDFHARVRAAFLDLAGGGARALPRGRRRRARSSTSPRRIRERVAAAARRRSRCGRERARRCRHRAAGSCR